MKKLFTKYLFAVLLIPVFILMIIYWFSDKDAIGTYGVNRTINFSGIDIDAILRLFLLDIECQHIDFKLYSDF